MSFGEEKCKPPERVCGFMADDTELWKRNKSNEVQNRLDNEIKKPHNMNKLTMFGKIISKIKSTFSKLFHRRKPSQKDEKCGTINDRIYVHDTDYNINGVNNCCLVNLEEVLKKGLK